MGRANGAGAGAALWALLLVLALVAGGCGGSNVDAANADPGEPRSGGTVVVAVAKEPPILNFWLAPGAMAITQQITDGLSDPIVVLDDKGTWRPVLATRVPTLDNGGVVLTDDGGMTVSFDLQPKAAWSDGTPISCEDVRFTWQVATDDRYQIATRLGWEQIRGVDCPTDRHVVIDFEERYAPYLSRILAWPPLPSHALEGKDFNTIWNDRIDVSSGPYVFESWQRGVRVSLRRNPHYWRTTIDPNAAGKLDRIVFRFVKDANTLKMQLRMEEADMAFIPADTNLGTELEATPDVEFKILPGAVMEFLLMRTDRAPLDDVRVRQALAHAIDRKMITKVILSDVVPPAKSPMVTTQAPQYEDDPYEQYATPDPDKVRELLTAAGWTRDGNGPWTKGGKPLTLKWVAGAGSMPFRAKVAQLVQEQLRRQGITTEIQLIPSEVLYSNTAPHGQFHLGEWSEITGAEPLPNLIFGCHEIPKAPSWAGKNRMAWCDDEAEQLMSRADTTVDVAERAALVRRADAIIAEQVPVIPLFQSPDVVAWNARVHGLQLNPAGLHTWNVEQWWVSG
jgi:peptide/nickel transport system substrate-binding protein